MTPYQAVSTQTIVDLANLRPDKEGALREFRQEHDLDYDLSANALTREQRDKYGNNPDERTLFFRDLAHRLWSGGDQGGIDLLQELLFPGGAVDVRIDWRHQGFAYQPKTKLQAAFYVLLGHNHLAKRCANPECAHPFFIGERVDERYCSDECKAAGRLATKRNWWKTNRATTTRGKK